ncbi:MAG: vacuolar family H+-ATPase subunit H, partial [Lachnospiraceae bacterium]|nr:vacuolar family H+-ATPase subunit H [Lachnospiraceae bacterium]
MSSKIEQLIDEIEEFIDGCKYKALSNTQIIVDKEQIDELLRELRMKTPEEIKRYQKIISNKEAILADAKEKAAALINEATVHTNELINEHEIMQQAYAQANEVVTLATNQAQEILDNATIEANTMREAAIHYTDDMLANVENIIAQSMEGAAFRYEQLMTGLNNCYETVKANRAE